MKSEVLPTKILLVEDNPGDARLVREMLHDGGEDQFILIHVDHLNEGIQLLRDNPCDVVMLDLQLPDSSGLATVAQMHEQIPSVPIVVMTGSEDERMGIDALRIGAQDYLMKGKADGIQVSRSLHYAIARQSLQDRMRSLSFLDELTGLYNRRGFLTLVEQQLQMVQREGREIMLLFIDIDQMKYINDTFGHEAGDIAIRDAAEIITKTFRGTDIKARIGGDEFAVAACGVHHADGEALVARLQRNAHALNAQHKRSFELSLSAGFARSDAGDNLSLTELMTRADAEMYADKHAHKLTTV